MQLQYQGLVAATLTPFTENGSVNLQLIPKYIDYLLKQDIRAVFVNGTTGEWPSLSVAERKIIAEEWIKYGAKKLDKIIIHCGAQSLVDAKDMANHAESIGADAIACIAPSVFKPDEDRIISYLKEVADSAKSTPFLFYHFPGLTGVEVDLENLLTRAYANIPNFVGLKLTTPKLSDVSICMLYMEEKPLTLFYGCDEQLYSAFAVGVKAAVGSCCNFLGREFNSIIKAATGLSSQQQKAVRSQHVFATKIFPMIKKYGAVPACKLLTSLYSKIDMGPPRLPLKHFTEEEREIIRECAFKYFPAP